MEWQSFIDTEVQHELRSDPKDTIDSEDVDAICERIKSFPSSDSIRHIVALDRVHRNLHDSVHRTLAIVECREADACH